MHELKLYVLVGIVAFMQDHRGKSAETMARHAALVAHALQTFQDSVITHCPAAIEVAWEYYWLAPVKSQSTLSINRLLRERDDVRSVPLHMVRRNVPPAGS